MTLPSTQNWQFLDGDTGAMNDLGSNLALIMTPDQKAAYERSVVDAMTKAGIGPKDSVMLVGFSQGGILAGKMAAENPPPFNIKAIVVAGAPIDAMPIPKSVQVMAFQHPADIVPQLDGASHADSKNWVTIRESPDKNQPDHGAISYGLTASHTVDQGKISAQAQQIVDKQSMFFSDNEIEHRYAGAESGVFG